MADDLDAILLQGIDLNAEENKPQGRQEPVTDMERFLLQNLYDTQPEKRKAYLDQLGFEMNPKNDNEYRPKGSKGTYGQIDPGVSAYFKKGGLKELGRDVGDVVLDFSLNAGLTGAGAAAGAGFGGGLGSALPVLGTSVGGAVGGITGGALGNAASESVKDLAGQIFLDKEIPQDMKLTAIQSIITGAMPVVLKAGAKATKSLIVSALKARRDATINAIKAAGGQITPELLTRATKNPEQFTEQAVKGATERLESTYKNIFGLSPDDPFTPKSTKQLNPDSIFGKAIQPLNQEADAEISRLSADKAANWKVGEIVQPMEKEISRLSAKFDRTADENAALSYLKSKIGYIYSKVEPRLTKTVKVAENVADYDPNALTNSLSQKAPKMVEKVIKPTMEQLKDAEISYKQGREILKAIQDDAFDRDIPGSSSLKAAIGGSPGGLRALADQKAAAAGSMLPQINAKRSAVLQSFQEARANLTPQKLTQAFVGSDTIAKENTKATLEKVGSVLDLPDLGSDVQLTGLQRSVENIYKNPKSFGTGRVPVAEHAIKGALYQGGMGYAAGKASGIPGAGPVLGTALGLKGAAQGAIAARDLASPERALNAVIQQTKAINAAPSQNLADLLVPQFAAPAVSAASEPVAIGLGQQAAREVAPALKERIFTPSQEELDRILLEGIE